MSRPWRSRFTDEPAELDPDVSFHFSNDAEDFGWLAPLHGRSRVREPCRDEGVVEDAGFTVGRLDGSPVDRPGQREDEQRHKECPDEPLDSTQQPQPKACIRAGGVAENERHVALEAEEKVLLAE